jgi:hypothetical protein
LLDAQGQRAATPLRRIDIEKMRARRAHRLRPMTLTLAIVLLFAALVCLGVVAAAPLE